MVARICLLTITDEPFDTRLEGSAQTVFEAAARASRHSGKTPGRMRSAPATRLEIQVPQPAITHTVTVQQLALG